MPLPDKKGLDIKPLAAKRRGVFYLILGVITIYKVVRIWESEIKKDKSIIQTKIQEAYA
jgi:hypothetical protein